MTHVMVKGSNVPLDAPGIRAVLRWSPASGTPDVDASVLLLGRDGRVRSDDDFVFYNEPRHPSGLARHLPKQRVAEGLTDTVEVDLAALDAGVDRVVIAASCDGGAFRQVRDLCVLLYDTSGPRHAPLVTFDVRPDTGDETALNCGELYRKDGGWKFRAVGQGYATGLVGLATEFGITVDDVEPEAGRADPQPASAPSRPQPQPEPGPTSAYGYPLQAPTGGHVPAQPAYGYPQPVAAQAPPPPPPTAPPVHQQPQPGYPAYGYPQPVGATAPADNGAAPFTLPPQGPQFQPDR
ncbi:TerD family protein [Actinacidiphila bryophytorum]|uniref:Stress response protein SCP2 n=1 Tax=Actinacidiphila bryophytorum TaxID=1436133 RepID=A0A9W4E9K8_9ACTN|nr:TerD family protein [Actinacidiphila bryophytorum]MBM9434714.1 TerD family protein [Actinacidiphila bryophytorum]MBN6543824.1 TerD family protein [Actinacidiphila bryophytorum]CAG7629224.1 Stress response protein SCP2 [Actinacidiphila bryophytorum]